MLESLRPRPRRAPGLADQGPGAAAGDAARRRGAEDPVHERDPRRDRRDRGRPDGGARGARRLRQPAGGHPPELRPAPALLRRGAGRDRHRGRRGVLAHRAARRPGRPRAGLVLAGDGRRHGAARARGAAADARRRHPDPAEPRRLVAAARRRGRDRPRRAERQRRPHLARAPVPVAAPGAQAARAGRRRADRAALRLPALHRPRVAGAGRARRDQGALLELHPAPRLRPRRRAEGRAAARHDRPRRATAARSTPASSPRCSPRRGPRRSRTCARRPTSCAPSWRATPSRSSSTATSTSRTSASSAARSAASARASARPTPTRTTSDEFVARVRDARRLRRDRDLHAVRASIPTGTLEDYERWLRLAKDDGAATSTCTRTRRWRSRTCATSPGCRRRGVRAAARGRPGLDAGHRGRGAPRRRARADQPEQAAGRALGRDHRGRARAPGCARR